MDHSTKFLVFAAFVLAFTVYTSEGIQCFQCNSFYNSSCADPFNETSQILIQSYLKECPSESTYCRKTDQTVRDNSRTVRQCGVIEDQMNCHEKVGSKTLRAHYCTCNSKDGCNSSSRLVNLGFGLQLIAATLLSYLVSSYIKI